MLMQLLKDVDAAIKQRMLMQLLKDVDAAIKQRILMQLLNHVQAVKTPSVQQKQKFGHATAGC